MIFTKSASLFMRVLILCSLTLFLQCFALPNTELKIEDINQDLSLYRQEEQVYSSDDHIRSSNSSNTDFIVVFIAAIVLLLIYIIIRCCKECENLHESDNVVHQPPPSQQLRQSVQIRRLVPAPPRTSSTCLILPTEDSQHLNAFGGIINPNYIPPANLPPNYVSQEMSDDPPSYDSVVRNSNTNFPNVVGNPPKY